ncbi:TrbI/VirB10 family protein [Megasphaera sp.]|uniref:TrbI/VirB10 family protein n=1 Tax=Megasphaera sp. TaxID=2023260 RepID=UPI0027BA60CB|nr:TrbI/VirB10 family protein [Megasphaera sp.]
MSLNNNLPGPILDILNRCRRKIRAFQHRDEAGQFQDTEELYRLSQEDLDRRPDDAYDPQEDYDMEFPEDEEADGSEAQRLHRKKIIGVAAGVAVVAVAAVIGNSIFPSSTNKNNTQKTGDQVAQVAPSEIPGSYSDIEQFSDKKGNKTAGQQTPGQSPNGVNDEYGAASTGTPPPRPSGTNYREKYANAAPAPAAAPPSSRPAATVTVTKESAAEKAAKEEAKETAAAMNSSAFDVAVKTTQAMIQQNNAGTAAAEAPVPGSTVAAEASYRDDTYNSSSLHALHAGTIIPATLLTGVTSDVPNSDVVAEVRQDVYDSQTGMYLLIPQGSRIIGTAGRAGNRGNARIGVIFTRIILPNGDNIELPNQQAIDGTGMPGLKDKYSQHSSAIFRSAFMTSLLGAAAQSATGNTSGDDDRSPGQEAVSGAVAQVMDAASKLVDRALDQEATITIRPGTAFSVFLNQDLLLRELNESL